MKKSAILCAAVMAASASPLSAQLGIVSEAFRQVNSIGVAAQGGRIPGSDAARPAESGCGGAGLCGGAAEVRIDLPSAGRALLELGIGAGVLQGIEAREPSLDLHASVRSFPTLSIYATLPGFAIEPYAGASFGVAAVRGARGYDAEGREYGLDATTFEYGATAGLALARVRGPFVEAAYRRRDFGSVDWDLSEAAADRVPEGWPRELDLSGWTLSVGWRFRLREHGTLLPPPDDRAPPPPLPVGVMTTKQAMRTDR